MNHHAMAEAALQEFSEFGYRREPYSVGPDTVAVLMLPITNEISVYVNFVAYPKDKSLGAGLGFGHPAIMAETDAGLRAVGDVVGVRPIHSLLNPCPATLFPLESFVGPERATLGAASGRSYGIARQLIHNNIVLGSHSWLRSRRDLLEFLSDGKHPFGWGLGGVPRRLCQIIYLMSVERIPRSDVASSLADAVPYLSEDPDFANNAEKFLESAIGYYYSRLH